MSTAWVRWLTLALAVVYAVLGTLELVLKVADGSSVVTIAFFGGTLLGGAAIVLGGLYAPVTSRTRQVLVILGTVAGLLASAWTVLVPLLAIVVIVANAQSSPDVTRP